MRKVAVNVKNIYEIIKVKEYGPRCGGYDSYAIYLVQLAIIPVHPQFFIIRCIPRLAPIFQSLLSRLAADGNPRRAGPVYCRFEVG